MYRAEPPDPQSRFTRTRRRLRGRPGAWEQTLAALARRAFEAGYTRIIAAGGETSARSGAGAGI